ncbi:MAG: hypothetical protein VX498_16065 [Myxococcota bacterium]|nr:hypothetical protein [Myxococcota bacterium]
MLTTHTQLALCLGLSLLYSGCGFFFPGPIPEPPPEPGTTMTCGETRDVTGLSGADALPLSIDLQTNFELLPDFDDPQLGMRLTVETDSSLDRSLELWDPSRDLRLIPGNQTTQADLRVELLGTSSLFSGSISLDCSQPAENCFNLTDDDGDGEVDCADIHCAWAPSCVEDQEDLEVLDLTCTEEAVEVVPTLTATDSQRTLYRTHPAGFDQPGLEFWGGAELVIRSVAAEMTNIEITMGSPGLLCVGEADAPLDAEVIECEDWNWFEAGVVSADPTERPIFLEPLGNQWESLSISVDCEAP